jgi:DNA-binding MarR family transcriptional regulator
MSIPQYERGNTLSDPVELLQQLGFSEYEARAYAALLQRNPLNGYELAKSSGLPRANIYSVLQKLEERGAVARLHTPDGVRYSPVSPEDLTRRLGSRYQGTLDKAQRSLGAIATLSEPDYVWNLRGHEVMLEHARTLLDLAQKNLIAAVWPEESLALSEDMSRAVARGVDVTTLCLAACAEECGACRGNIYRYRAAPHEGNRWLIVVPDGTEALLGEIDPSDQVQAVRTREPLLVELAEWFVRHSIALAAVLTDLGTHLDGLLRPETYAALASAGPGGPGGNWLEHMRKLLSRPQWRALDRQGDQEL